MDQFFQQHLQQIMNEQNFIRFDRFILEELGFKATNDNIADVRKDAFKDFMEKIEGRKIASLPTMRKWFGIGGFSKPTREHVYEMCFYLRSNREEMERFLVVGLGEPSFQINDYQEIIFLYGIEHKLTYENCLNMIHMFEQSMDCTTSFQKTHTTHELLRQYEANRDLSVEEFIIWMVDRADWFKGYSQTTMDYLLLYKKMIVKNIRNQASAELSLLLSETKYETYLAKHPLLKKNSKESIVRYLKKAEVSDDLRACIMELVPMVYSKNDTNELVLSELFSGYESSKEIKSMTNKHFSDLLNIPLLKERSIRTVQAIRELERLSVNDICPQWILDFCQECSRKKLSLSSVRDTKDWLLDFQKEHKRRCLLIQRSDLLPMILYVAEDKYWQQYEDYDSNIARKIFEDMANATLTACNMAPLNDDYIIDVVLLNCFQENTILNYTDVLEITKL